MLQLYVHLGLLVVAVQLSKFPYSLQYRRSDSYLGKRLANKAAVRNVVVIFQVDSGTIVLVAVMIDAVITYTQSTIPSYILRGVN